jgi:hypothetical protein
VNTGLGQHGVVLDLGLAERRAVTGDDDQLGCFMSIEIKPAQTGTIIDPINIPDQTRITKKENQLKSYREPTRKYIKRKRGE